MAADTGQDGTEPADPDEVRRSAAALLLGFDGIDAWPAPGVDDALRAVIIAAESILGVDCIGVLLLDDHDQLRAVASTGPIAAAVERAQEDLGVGPGRNTVADGVTVVVSDLQADARYALLAHHLQKDAVRAIVSAPIWVNGAVAGNLNAMRRTPGGWGAHEVAAVEIYADVVSALLQLHTGDAGGGRGGGAR